MFIIVLIAIALSIDAFSLSLAYGTLGLEKKKIILLSIVVGIYHFLMPLIGMVIGNKIMEIIPIQPKIIVFIILIMIGIQMIVESFKEDSVHPMELKELLIFGFAVSVDSFSVGLGLKVLTDSIYLAVFTFSIFSFLFTFLGLKLGKKINHLFGKKATMVGGILLILIAIYYLLG